MSDCVRRREKGRGSRKEAIDKGVAGRAGQERWIGERREGGTKDRVAKEVEGWERRESLREWGKEGKIREKTREGKRMKRDK